MSNVVPTPKFPDRERGSVAPSLFCTLAQSSSDINLVPAFPPPAAHACCMANNTRTSPLLRLSSKGAVRNTAGPARPKCSDAGIDAYAADEWDVFAKIVVRVRTDRPRSHRLLMRPTLLTFVIERGSSEAVQVLTIRDFKGFKGL